MMRLYKFNLGGNRPYVVYFEPHFIARRNDVSELTPYINKLLSTLSNDPYFYNITITIETNDCHQHHSRKLLNELEVIHANPSEKCVLSRCQLEVIQELSKGISARQAGINLHKSEGTVCTLRKQAFEKLGVHKLSAAVELLRMQGFI